MRTAGVLEINSNITCCCNCYIARIAFNNTCSANVSIARRHVCCHRLWNGTKLRHITLDFSHRLSELRKRRSHHGNHQRQEKSNFLHNVYN